MTAAQTRKLVQTYYDAFNRQDVEGMLACLGPGFVHEVSQGERRKGKALFKDFLVHMNRSYRETLSDIVVMTDASGKRAAAEFDLRGRYLATDPGLPKATGQRYKLRVGAFFEIRNGRISRVSTHYNLKDWTRQVAGA
ncbi:MAG: ketosteroid isomerase-related protein [Parvibaculaceae bacterium]